MRIKRLIIGVSLLVLGLTLKIVLTHNINYWGFSKNVSIILFIIGLISLTPLRFMDSSENAYKKNKSSKIILLSALNLIVIAVIFVCGFGLERFGSYLNYKTRDYFLSHNTENTTGVIHGIKKIKIVKVGQADFYEIDFKANGKIYSNGLLVDYLIKDNENFDKSGKTEISENTMDISKLKGKIVKIVYSKRFPSFFRIEE